MKDPKNHFETVQTWYVVRGTGMRIMRFRDRPWQGFLLFAEAKRALLESCRDYVTHYKEELAEAQKLTEKDVSK